MTTATRTRKPSSKAARPSANEKYAEIGQRLIDQITSSGHLTWQSPYLVSAGLPRSLSTGKAYRGINVWLLLGAQMEHGWSSAWYGTYRHITEQGGQVRKDEHSTQIVWWSIFRKDEVNPATGETVTKRIPVMRTFNVFNVAQADWANGLPAKCSPAARGEEYVPSDEAEAIVERYVTNGGPTLSRKDQQGAWYRPSDDTVNIPLHENLKGNDERYATTFHELTHSTGHAKRLGREGIVGLVSHRRGSVYSFEELVAEFGAAFLCTSVEIDSTLDNSAAYLKSWVSYLSDDPSALPRAAMAAQRAVDLILGTTFDNDGEDD